MYIEKKKNLQGILVAQLLKASKHKKLNLSHRELTTALTIL
jgi:hypothetical protein